jgi:hypothetical protein
MTPHISPLEAQAALRAADSAATRTRHRARWGATSLAVFGVGWAAMTLALGLTDLMLKRPFVLPAIGSAFMLLMGVWASRQPAVLAESGRRALPCWIGSGLFYTVALAVGVNRFKGEPGYWIPAAVLVGAPLIIGAWRESRA